MNKSSSDKEVEFKEIIRKIQNDLLYKRSLQYGFDFMNDKPLNQKNYSKEESKADTDVNKNEMIGG